LVFNSWSSLYILDINHLSDEELAKVFSHSVGYLLILVIISFAVQLFLRGEQHFIFNLYTYVYGCAGWGYNVAFTKVPTIYETYSNSPPPPFSCIPPPFLK
jgi:hypothetical protein